MDPIAITLAILLVAVIAFVSNRVPVGIVALAVAISLWATGILTLGQALAGFADPTVLFIASLFVVSEGLDATGVTAWAGQKVIGAAGTSTRKLLVYIMLLVAVLTALISVNGAVAALLPVVVVVAVRAGLAPSRLLLPLAFAAHAGSLLALTGTPVNIIVSEAAVEAGDRAFGFFEFGLVGVPLVVGTLLITMLLGSRLVPVRAASVMPRDLSDHARVLRSQYELATPPNELIGAEGGIAEVVIPPRSSLIGLKVFPGMCTPSGSLVILAVQRGGEQVEGPDATLAAGDTLLLEGSWDALDEHTADPDVLVVDPPDVLRRTVPLGPRAGWAIGILAAMIAALATGLVPAVIAGLVAAMAMVLTRAVSVTQAYRSISWTTVVLVAGMIPLSTAFMQTGAADLIADGLLGMVGDAGPQVALFALCLITVVLGQLISNTATVLIVIPVAVSVAATKDVSVLPFLMALTVAGAASFLTPIATPANMMVMGPGGFRFTDYWKLGLPLLVFFLAVATFYVPLIWPF
ncbi:SLC13 family permease [Microterricola viridarii]|uniref:Di-and tricarboxylate transporter n=1 Tax=Microterricola viridarii TaxID=412690 RepID=A0A1H1LKB8_9MICO|nr:SLC13 family permease [Microterricola viridarii]SDR74455.1 Di-and tricarboxylate transporter [Microterricola viridarii]